MVEENKEKEKERIENALMKVAIGYRLAEVTEEYAEVDGEWKLTKRKKTKKDIPPDLKAVQLLLSGKNGEYSAFSDGELEKEKERLLQLLKEQEEGDRVASKENKVKKTAKTKKKIK